MNCHVKCVQFDTKQEENSPPVTEIKTEPQDIEIQLKMEVEECDTKQEIYPIHGFATLIKGEETQENVDELLEGCINKPQVEQKNGEEDETNMYAPTVLQLELRHSSISLVDPQITLAFKYTIPLQA